MILFQALIDNKVDNFWVFREKRAVHIGAKYTSVIKALISTIKAVSIATDDFPQRCCYITGLATVVLKANSSDFMTIQIAAYGDIADTACSIAAGSRIIIEKFQPLNLFVICTDIILSKQLITAANQ